MLCSNSILSVNIAIYNSQRDFPVAREKALNQNHMLDAGRSCIKS